MSAPPTTTTTARPRRNGASRPALGSSSSREVPLTVQRKAARSLSDEHLLCRLKRHLWDGPMPVDPQHLRRHSWGTPMQWECTRCGMVRVEVIDARGELSWHKYDQPDGYRLGRGRTPSTAVLRKEFVRRLKARRREEQQ